MLQGPFGRLDSEQVLWYTFKALRNHFSIWTVASLPLPLKAGTEFYYVELIAPQEIRLQRNVTENRLKHKASKRDIETSNRRLINDDNQHRCVSREGEIPFDNYLRIENSDLPADEAARMIKERFDL